MKGRIHSVESFGTVDGPGIRLVVFMQGCPMRCFYCHNPDTWDISGGSEMSVDEIVSLFMRHRPFYSGGGVTVTGGEPLLQLDFLIELFSRLKERGIHTCLDTSGITFKNATRSRFDELMRCTDLVMLDVKHADDEKHKQLTGHSNSSPLAFAEYVSECGVDLWIRHVVVEGYTDDPDDLFRLGTLIGKLKTLKALDVLPYHDLGAAKYRELGIPYPLEGVTPLPRERAKEAREHILRGIRSARSKK